MCLQVDWSYCSGGWGKNIFVRRHNGHTSICSQYTRPTVLRLKVLQRGNNKPCVVGKRKLYRLFRLSAAIVVRFRDCIVSCDTGAIVSCVWCVILHVPYYHSRCPRSAALYKRNPTPSCCGHAKKTASVRPMRLDEKAKFLPPGRGLFLVDYEMSRGVFVVMHCHEGRLGLGQGGESVRGWGVIRGLSV